MSERRTDLLAYNLHCPYLHASRNCEATDRIVQRFPRAPNYSKVLSRAQTQGCQSLSPIFVRRITRPLAGFQWQCCTNVADIPRPGIPSVHEHEFYGKSTGRYVPLTHSASSFTRALVMTSVICDAFMIRQVKSVK